MLNIIAISLIGIFCVFLLIKGIISYSKKSMMDTFKSLSFDLMERNNRSFLDLASNFFERYQDKAKDQLEIKQKEMQSIINPLKESVDKMDFFTRDIEKQRQSAYVSLSKQIDSLIKSEDILRSETKNLTKALKSPNIRGAWGQIHLKRVIEIAGMLDHCDFFEQKTVGDEKIFRPDLVIQLPGERQIVIDAKTPIDAYLEAAESNDEEYKKRKLKDHAQHIKKHIKDLSSKEYYKQFFPSVEFVIMFLPAEAFFSAAIGEDPTLLEIGAKYNVIIATPTTLIAILRAISYSWKQDNISKSAKEIAKIGKELHERLLIMTSHFSNVGKSISQTVDSYNKTIASFESRVLVSAKKLKEMGLATQEDNPVLKEITKICRSSYADEIENG